jgi:hypothetical protein
LPIIDVELYTEGLPIAEMLGDPGLDPRKGYPFQTGQPEAVRLAYMDAMGLDPNALVEAGASFLSAAGANTSRRVWV